MRALAWTAGGVALAVAIVVVGLAPWNPLECFGRQDTAAVATFEADYASLRAQVGNRTGLELQAAEGLSFRHPALDGPWQAGDYRLQRIELRRPEGHYWLEAQAGGAALRIPYGRGTQAGMETFLDAVTALEGAELRQTAARWNATRHMPLDLGLLRAESHFGADAAPPHPYSAEFSDASGNWTYRFDLATLTLRPLPGEDRGFLAVAADGRGTLQWATYEASPRSFTQQEAEALLAGLGMAADADGFRFRPAYRCG